MFPRKERKKAELFCSEMKAAMKLPTDVFIRAGYSANAEIILDKRNDVLMIPESSLEFGDSAVYLVKSEKPQTFERKLVKIGLSDEIHIEVQNGLQLNDRNSGNKLSTRKSRNYMSERYMLR